MRVFVIFCTLFFCPRGLSNELIEAGGDSYVFISIVIFSKPDGHNLSCTRQHKKDARAIAVDKATAQCEESDYPVCTLRGSRIMIDGYIGFYKGGYYGYGCVAEAQVKGHF